VEAVLFTEALEARLIREDLLRSVPPLSARVAVMDCLRALGDMHLAAAPTSSDWLL